MLFQAAYRDNTLGLPKLCPPDNVSKIDRNVLYTYLSQHHVPSRMVVAGVGVDHNKLVEVVQKHFVDKEPIWGDQARSGGVKRVEVDTSIAQYTGGIIVVCLCFIFL